MVGYGWVNSLKDVPLAKPVHRRAAVDVVEPDTRVGYVEMAGILVSVVVLVADERPFPLLTIVRLM